MDPASSSSSATEVTVAGLLRESFAVLASELPPAWDRFCSYLDGCAVEIDVDGEVFTVYVASRVAAVADAPNASPHARIGTSRRTLGDVLDARLSVRDAVMRDELQVVAPLAMITRLYEGLLAYVHGGVRCPSFPTLLKRFRAMPARPAPEPPSP
jgi:hypothetical protein